jgi:hypothetical protein
MSKVIAHILVCSLLFVASEVRSQQSNSSATDSATYAMPADSARALDSAYRARKAELDRWIRAQRGVANPQEDFISLYAGYGGYLQILPRDLNQLFSERTRPPSDLTSDRNAYSTVDRAVILSGQAQLAQTWGIYFEYDLVEKWFNTIVDSTGFVPQPNYGAQEELDLTEHSFIVGGMYVIYSGPFYRLRANGGIGGVIALTTETESPGGYSRSASATGYQINFDLLNDFRVSQGVSFTLDIVTRSVTTGELKTSGGQTLDAPFGARKTPLTIQPNASNVVYGLAAGLVIYF